MNGSPHADITTQPTMSSHDMSSVFPTKADPSSATNGPGPIHVVMGDACNSVKMNSMDFLESGTPGRASAPSFIPDFPSTNGFRSVSHINNRAAMHSSPSGASVSSNPSHGPSPAMHGALTNYSGSSLAAALDSMEAPRSRSGSSASPCNFANTTPEFTYVSGHPSPEFHFPPVDMTQDQKQGSPDAPADSHLMAIGGLLEE